MTMEDILRDFVLQLLRRGFTVAQIAEALAAQKIALMQADEYLSAIKESDLQP
jgi:DNA-binding transcriptional MerR regulator